MTTPTTYSVELSPVEARLIEYALNALEAIYGGLNDKWPDPATAAQVNRVRVLQQLLGRRSTGSPARRESERIAGASS